MVAGRQRYWTFSELHRKFARYSKTVYSKYQDYWTRMHILGHFFERLKKEKQTIYTATQASIQSFADYLFSFQQSGGRGGYSKLTLQRKIYEVYRFYEWLVEEKLLDKTAFPYEFYQELGEQIRSRDRPRNSRSFRDEAVPEVFGKIYDTAREMDRQRCKHPTTLFEHKKSWAIFLWWLERKGIQNIQEVNEKILIEYPGYLEKYCSPHTGHRLTAGVTQRRLIGLKVLFRYLAASLWISRDPSYVIALPKCVRGLPRTLMSRGEIEKMLELPDVTTSYGVRDRAMMEVLYSTGVRRNELRHLKIEDIFFQEGLLRIMVPKGGVAFQRVIPIGEVALKWVKQYLQEVRPRFISGQTHKYLFITHKGTQLLNNSLSFIIKNYCYRAGFRKKITTHSFRVTCATEMLRNRADIRYVQEQLGHRTIQSTQIYTRVLPTDLKKVHQRTHPRERRRSSVIASEAKQSL